MDFHNFVKIALLVIGVLTFLILMIFSLIFSSENEKRPSLTAFISAIALSSVLFLFAYFSSDTLLSGIILIIILLFLLFLAIPFKYKTERTKEEIDLKLDEREVMFSRAELIPDTDRFKEYYEAHPEHKFPDDKFRSKPGLLSDTSQKYHPLRFASADGNFEAVEAFKNLRNTIEVPVSDQIKTDPSELSLYIKTWLKQIGALSVGITELKEFHKYKVKGRGKDYGKKIDLNHKFAIAITVEMDKNMIDRAPDAETVMESSQQYFRSAAISAQLTLFIRNLGYSAKPHFDGNYDVLCPTIARDAGLGEIGRMGLLMSHEIGPRMRIVVVTTDIPLIIDQRNFKGSMVEFCKICKKCADNCPTKAISFDDQSEEKGLKRWTINHEACFTYWNIIGTDCAKCIQVCPYSHPDNFMHNLIRKGIDNSRFFASAALKADDLFYGRKPKKKSN
jgi:reductive dehalogenase